MSIFTIIFKVFPYLLPFIKEMLIGKKTWKQALKENKGKTILAIVVIVQFVLNVILATKLGVLAFNYVELARAKQELEKRAQVQATANKPPESSAKHPLSSNSEITADVKKDPAKPSPHVTNAEAEAIKAEFEKLRQREERESH